MGLRQIRKRLREERKNMLRRFRKEKRQNLLANPGEHEYIIVLDHLKPDFNIGKIFRSADAFAAREVHLIGTDFFSPVPAMGSFKWVPARFHETFDTCYEELIESDYTLFTMEPSADETILSVSLPERSAFIFGNEGLGISFDKAEYNGIRSLKIPQLGKVESLNVSIAASIVMYEYVRQHGKSV
ncbi:TrmH family RNA methyltransferase [Desulfobacterales bacterium HSG2]|nr:TrmH family RNA methyltransferase [Desulfobacterales bacterium HSG2]